MYACIWNENIILKYYIFMDKLKIEVIPVVFDTIFFTYQLEQPLCLKQPKQKCKERKICVCCESASSPERKWYFYLVILDLK